MLRLAVKNHPPTILFRSFWTGLFCLGLSLLSFSQASHWMPLDTLYADPQVKMTRVYPHSRNPLSHSRANSAQFIVKYSGFSAAQQAAFQYALDLWGNELFTTVPISIEASLMPLGPGILGSASANLVQSGTAGMPFPTAFYPSALRNQYEGCDLIPSEVDIRISLNNSTNWYLGTDLNPGPTQYDFVSVVMHELGHGLGFAGTGSYDDGVGANECNGVAGDGCIGLSAPSSNYMVYDQFVETGLAVAITTITNPSAGMGNTLTGNSLFWNGANATTGNLGVKPKLYAPLTFQAGSSYSHLDETTFPAGNPHSLMTPSISAGEAVHDIGNLTRGLMEDIGWTLANTPQVRFTSDAVGYTSLAHSFLDASALASAWAWDFDNDAIPDDFSQNPTHLFPSAGIYPIRLTINNNPALTQLKVIEIYDTPTVPFFLDFETNGSGFFANEFSCNNWEWSNGSGKPNYSGLPSATFGSNSWFTRANGTHGSYSLYYLETPPINMVGATGDYFLEFDFRGVVSADAGMNVEYSTNGGNIWQVLGPSGMADPDAINDWYNVTNIVGLGGENGWAPGPLQAVTEYHPNFRINLVKGFPDVRFRLKFGSDASSMFDGFQIDNFEINGSVLSAASSLALHGKQLAQGSHQLNWEDVSVNAGTQFAVERKVAGGNFLAIAKLDGQPEQAQYAFVDKVPFPGENQYRVRKMEANGHLTWSSVVALHHHLREPVRIAPNPFSTALTLQWFSETPQQLEFVLFNAGGQLVYRTELQGQGWQEVNLSLPALPGGLYLYRINGPEVQMHGKLMRNDP